MTDRVQDSKEALLKAIRESDICRQYEACKEQIRQYPEKLAAVNQFRAENFRMQSSGEAGNEEIWDRLTLEKESLIKDPLIADYLEAELSFCRMLQRVCMDIMSITDLQL